MPDPTTIQCGCGASHAPEHPHFGDQERRGATIIDLDAKYPANRYGAEEWWPDFKMLRAQLADRDAHIARLTSERDNWAEGCGVDHIRRIAALSAENEAMRGALDEMLQSFTEPEDDNAIIRRARAALDAHQASPQHSQDRL